ncbi:hypothetical protein ABZV14_02225 [Streptosporangium canum]|uniref:hypothetical protein n=1 Tax=Streptosporangium canum TaxID=324952 RepID=UPI0033B8E389
MRTPISRHRVRPQEEAKWPPDQERVPSARGAPVHGHVSTRQELDDYEWAWAGSLASWALDHPDHPDSSQSLATAAVHRSEWLRVYRGTWGFVSLVLRQTPA